MYLRVHAERFHALELRARDLVEVGIRPAQALDRLLPVDRLVHVEESIDRLFHLDVRIEINAPPGERLRQALQLRHILRFRVAGGPQELRGHGE
jgi:hypothetical protein